MSSLLSRCHRPRLEVLEDRTTPANLLVNTLSQANVRDDFLGLREAVAVVNRTLDVADLTALERQQVSTAKGGLGTGDTIKFQAAGTINLTSQLTLSRDVTIQGPGGAGLTVSGQNRCRVFEVESGVDASLRDLTITGGNANDDQAKERRMRMSAGGDGGGVYNSGTLGLTNCTLTGNSAERRGGGIYNVGTLSVNHCTLTGNSADYDGGGISNDYGGTATLSGSTLSGNSAGWDGGGIYNWGTLTLADCTLSGNDADDGGGIHNWSEMTLTNCTLSDNSASHGGGINNGGSMTLNNCTLSDNSAVVGGGFQNSWEGFWGTATLNNSIVANSVGGDIVNEGTLQGSNNLVEDSTGLSDWLFGDPNLGELRDNGGPTKTHALLPSSVAIDRGNNALIPGGVTTDQRGEGRISGPAVDLGATEMQQITVADKVYRGRAGHRLAVPSARGLLNEVVQQGTEPMRVEVLKAPAARLGTLRVNDDGSLVFVPRNAAVKAVCFTARVFDGQAWSEPFTVTLKLANPAFGRRR
jgi:hypothetical protein